MTARFAHHRHRFFKLADRRAQERSTLMATIALYSAMMSQLGGDRPDPLGLLRSGNAALCAHQCRPGTSYHQVRVAAGGLKLHSLGPRLRSTRTIRNPAPTCC